MNDTTASENSDGQNKQNTLLLRKRPLILTIFCIGYFFIFVWNFVELLAPAGYSEALTQLPNWFVFTQFTFFYPIGLASVAGVWFMRRWGIFLFCILVVLSWIIMVFGLHLLPRIPSILLSIGFCAFGFGFRGRMK